MPNGTGRAGRDLEVVVALVEQLLANSVVEVRSPEVVKGQSGTEREIDVTIRGRVGSTPIFVMIECRDRDSTQGVDWIDQVKGKADDVRPDKVIVVSSSSFSEPACQSAAHHKIELRRFEELTPDDLLGWMSPTLEHIVLTIHCSDVRHVTVELEPGLGLVEGVTRETFSGEFRRTRDGVVETFLEAWDHNVTEAAWNGLGIGDRELRTINLNFTNPADRLEVRIDDDWCGLSQLKVRAELWIEEDELPVRRLRYMDGSGTLTEGFDFKYSAGRGRQHVVVTVTEDGDGRLFAVAHRSHDSTGARGVSPPHSR